MWSSWVGGCVFVCVVLLGRWVGVCLYVWCSWVGGRVFVCVVLVLPVLVGFTYTMIIQYTCNTHAHGTPHTHNTHTPLSDKSLQLYRLQLADGAVDGGPVTLTLPTTIATHTSSGNKITETKTKTETTAAAASWQFAGGCFVGVGVDGSLCTVDPQGVSCEWVVAWRIVGCIVWCGVLFCVVQLYHMLVIYHMLAFHCTISYTHNTPRTMKQHIHHIHQANHHP